MGHTLSVFLGFVVARIAQNAWLKENFTAQHNLSFVRNPNSIAVLFTHISDQSTQRTLRVPPVPFLFGAVHMIFCPKIRK